MTAARCENDKVVFDKLDFNFLHGLGAFVGDMDVDKDHGAVDPNLSVQARRELDVLDLGP